jgi:D-sedoheptulose 7-phosphate isomerase
MSMEDVTQSLRDSAALKLEVAATQGEMIQAMIDAIWESWQQGGKLLLCGNGGSAADAQHLATELIVRLQAERHALPALALTTDTSLLTAASNDWGFETVFARQLEGLGKPGDVLLAISTSGNSQNVIRAVEQAQGQDIKTLGLLGKNGGALRDLVDLAWSSPRPTPNGCRRYISRWVIFSVKRWKAGLWPLRSPAWRGRERYHEYVARSASPGTPPTDLSDRRCDV